MSVETVYRCDNCQRPPDVPGVAGVTVSDVESEPSGHLAQWRQVTVVTHKVDGTDNQLVPGDNTFHLCEACLIQLSGVLPPNVQLLR